MSDQLEEKTEEIYQHNQSDERHKAGGEISRRGGRTTCANERNKPGSDPGSDLPFLQGSERQPSDMVYSQ